MKIIALFTAFISLSAMAVSTVNVTLYDHERGFIEITGGAANELYHMMTSRPEVNKGSYMARYGVSILCEKDNNYQNYRCKVPIWNKYTGQVFIGN